MLKFSFWYFWNEMFQLFGFRWLWVSEFPSMLFLKCQKHFKKFPPEIGTKCFISSWTNYFVSPEMIVFNFWFARNSEKCWFQVHLKWFFFLNSDWPVKPQISYSPSSTHKASQCNTMPCKGSLQCEQMQYKAGTFTRSQNFLEFRLDFLCFVLIGCLCQPSPFLPHLLFTLTPHHTCLSSTLHCPPHLPSFQPPFTCLSFSWSPPN